MNIIVTGATGFIGASIVAALIEKKHQVYVVTRPKSKLELLKQFSPQFEEDRIFCYRGNINELKDFFRQVEPDIVIHLAALFIAEHKSEDIKDIINSNILFSAEIMEATVYSRCKCFLNTSTSWQYYSEKMVPSSLYAATKKSVETLLSYYVDSYELSAINITIFDSYGVKDPRRKVMNLLRDTLVKDESIEMSGGEQILELVYIDDIVNAYLLVIDILISQPHHTMKTYFLHSDEPKSLKEIARLFEKVSGRRLKIDWGKRPYRKREVMQPYKGGEKPPGWSQCVRLEEGISRLIDEGFGLIS